MIQYNPSLQNSPLIKINYRLSQQSSRGFPYTRNFHSTHTHTTYIQDEKHDQKTKQKEYLSALPSAESIKKPRLDDLEPCKDIPRG